MLFSRKYKQSLKSVVKADSVTSEVSLSKGDKIFSRIILGAMSAAPFGAMTVHMDNLNHLVNSPGGLIGFGAACATSSLVGFGISRLYLYDSRRDHIAKKLAEAPSSMYVLEAGKGMKKAKTGKSLVNSFLIREKVEVEVDSWRQAPAVKVSETDATHTVNHYLIKDDGKYRLEQEVIANDETIWDLSANALVEVYGVQEKTKLKELTHE